MGTHSEHIRRRRHIWLRLSRRAERAA